MKFLLICFVFVFAGYSTVRAGQKVTRISDVIYDHKDGLAFVFDIIIPEKQNGAAILNVVSGGWVSRAASTMPTDSYKPYTDEGYTVFVISHCSQPRYTVPEIFGQVQRAIRFIRYNAVKYGIDPTRFGITGASAGGHLSVSAAVFGSDGVSEEQYRKIHPIPAKQAVDPVELVSCRVQAVACFYPPTNFVNYTGRDSNWFDFPKVRNVSVNGSFIATPDSSKEFQNRALKAISPYFSISKATPPVLAIHGTADELVPFSQSVSLMEKLKQFGIPCALIPREGKKHGWPFDKSDDELFINWFDKYLSKQK